MRVWKVRQKRADKRSDDRRACVYEIRVHRKSIQPYKDAVMQPLRRMLSGVLSDFVLRINPEK